MTPKEKNIFGYYLPNMASDILEAWMPEAITTYSTNILTRYLIKNLFDCVISDLKIFSKTDNTIDHYVRPTSASVKLMKFRHFGKI